MTAPAAHHGILLAVPNVSEGRQPAAIDQIGQAFHTKLLDVHSDPDHHRTVFTLAGRPGELAGHVRDGARQAIELIDVARHDGLHPRIGAIDVAPIVYVDEADRGAAIAEALVLADMLGEELRTPVFLYGQLAGGRTRAELRRGGPSALAERIEAGELKPDFGPSTVHARAGAVLVTARPPLVAFNVELAPPATLKDARAIAATIREGGSEGLPGVRAIGLWLAARNVAQVSMNVEEHRTTRLAEVVAAIARRAQVARGGTRRAGAPRGVRRLPAGHSGSQQAVAGGGARPQRRSARLKSRERMAQTKRKRRSKHRGNAAGTVEARGRTGRPPTAEERKKNTRTDARERRLNTPPTWKGSSTRAGFAAGIMFVFLILTTKNHSMAAAAVFAVLAFVLYAPAGYYLETYLFRRRVRKKEAAKAK